MENKEPSNQPNLTTNIVGGFTTKAGYQRYATITECAKARHIPLKVLTQARKENAPGSKKGSEVYWELLQPWLTDNWQRIHVSESDGKTVNKDADREYWELRRIKAQTLKDENVNRASNPDYIKRKLVLGKVTDLVGHTIATLRRYFEQEQPFKCQGMSAVQLKQANIDVLTQLFSDLKKPLNEWAAKSDLISITDAEANETPL